MAKSLEIRLGTHILLVPKINGVFLVVYFIGHVYQTSSLVHGENTWNAMFQITQTPGGLIFLILIIGAGTFHSTNKTRLIFTPGGKGLGNLVRPDYPYDAISLNYRQSSPWGMGCVNISRDSYAVWKYILREKIGQRW
jgi:succinate dehydrogenase hydrophobic anchor subunit